MINIDIKEAELKKAIDAWADELGLRDENVRRDFICDAIKSLYDKLRYELYSN